VKISYTYNLVSIPSSCAACMLPFHSGCRITQANDREYHYECFCCEKCSQAINGTYTMSPDGSKFKVSKKRFSKNEFEMFFFFHSVEIVFDNLLLLLLHHHQ
jgi:hypothetical protein